eukprot:8249420-Pyramimonas_sp.AAC.1
MLRQHRTRTDAWARWFVHVAELLCLASFTAPMAMAHRKNIMARAGRAWLAMERRPRCELAPVDRARRCIPWREQRSFTEQ